MAKFISLSLSTLLFLSLLLLLLLPQSSALSPSSVCNLTPFPSFCRSELNPLPNSTTVDDFARFSLQKSLSASTKFLALIETLLRRQSKNPTSLAARALADCKSLTESTIENLETTSQTLAKSPETLPASQADDLQTLLSACLTNTQTCNDGLQAVVAPDEAPHLSVSLALFANAWGSKKRKKGREHLPIRKKHLRLGNGRLNLKMAADDEEVYRRASSHRRLLQDGGGGDNQVVVSDIVVVSKDGGWNYTSINEAVAAAPNNTDGSTGYFLIYVTEGLYEENVVIPKNKRYVMVVGDGINRTVITGNRSVGGGWTTFETGTLIVTGTGFFAVGITVRNTAGAANHQAVAVRGSADYITFYSCSFEAYQDTLYAHSFRQFYSECDIYGTVDFIFGNAAVVIQNSNIYPRLPMPGQSLPITAQGRTDPNQNTGISIHNCTVRPADDLAASNRTVRTYLGRPWKEYSRTVYMQTFLEGLIDPAGWSVWSGDFALSTLYYAEFGNFGPGADTARRVTWPGYRVINATEAVNFTVSAFILGDNDWLGRTGVDYTPGLLL